MNPSSLKKILVVGGNGFIGSAVCRAALARGFQVTSVSSSGRPYQTSKGHTPAWTSKIDWQQGDAFQPESFAHLFPEVEGVVHTLGTLIEDGKYKQALKGGSLLELMGSFNRFMSNNGNPLKDPPTNERKGSYEAMNRDAALRVCEAFISSETAKATVHNTPRPFVYLSAEDIFRPIVPMQYIKTKREAEQGIEALMVNKPGYRGVYIRPSLVYHAHYRPLTTPAAVLLNLSATLHSKIPPAIPTPSSILRTLGSSFPHTANDMLTSPLDSMANALIIPPIHVDHVAEAICLVLDSSRTPIHGVVGVKRMRELLGWSDS